jgi:hypothetical protein
MTPEHGPPGLVWPALTRHWRVILGITAGVGLAVAIVLNSADVRTYYRTSRYLVAAVPASATDARPIVTLSTDRIARNYATVLGSDDGLLSTLAARVGRSTEAVRDRLFVGYQARTSTIVVYYRGDNTREVRAFFAEFDRQITSFGIPSTNLPPRAVRPMRSGAKDVVSLVDPLRAHPAWGLLAGLVTGLATALALERAHPRVAGRAHLQSVTDLPVLEVSGGSSEALEAVVVRLLAPEQTPRRVVVVPVEASHRDISSALVDRIRRTAVDLVTQGTLAPAAETVPVLLDVPAVPAISGTSWLVVTRPGASVRAVGAALERLARSGRVLVVLLSSGSGTVDEPPPARPLAQVGT